MAKSSMAFKKQTKEYSVQSVNIMFFNYGKKVNYYHVYNKQKNCDIIDMHTLSHLKEISYAVTWSEFKIIHTAKSICLYRHMFYT